MDLQQAKILLEKINSLYKSIDTDEGKLASIERDLMLNYLQQLYELFLQADSSTASPQEISSREESSTKPANRPRPEPLKRTYKPPRIIEIPDSGKEKTSASSSQTGKTDTPEPTQEEPRPESQKQQAPEPSQTPRTSADASEIDSLFEQRRATELSEKLSESPVHDLSKALAINDRLLYMNELFGKNMNALDETLLQLNRYDNMEEAKPLLKDLAILYNWTEEERLDAAKSFIKLVRRRYSQ